MKLFKRRTRKNENSSFAYFVSSGGCLPTGYHKLLDSPEVAACIDRITAIVSSATIYLMRNTAKGDKREKGNLAKFVDVTPWPDMGTRSSWMSWIVGYLLADGDGNAYVLPHISEGKITALEPMPGASSIQNGSSYITTWQGRQYSPDEILHFRLFANLQEPWKGRGYRVQAQAIAASLKQTEDLKDSLSSPKYKPPLIVAVNSDTQFKDEEEREEFRKKFLEDTDSGKPWILPADLVNVIQAKPLTLTDLAIKDTVELDKKTVASIFGVPPFLLGLGTFNAAEYNNFIRTVIIPICKSIEQELTDKLLVSDDLYFKFNRRHLYAYDIKDLVDIYTTMSDRGQVHGDDVREVALLDPVGLTEYKVLENYIPYDKSGDQKKLKVSKMDTEKED